MRIWIAAILALGFVPGVGARVVEEVGLGTAALHFPSDAWSAPPLAILAPGPALWDQSGAALREALLDAGLAVLEPLSEEPDPLALDADLSNHPRLDLARIAVVTAEEEDELRLRAHFVLGCEPIRTTVTASAEPIGFARGGGCDAVARAWDATGARVRVVRAAGGAAGPLPASARLVLPSGDGAPRLLIEAWPGAVRITPGEASAVLRHGLLGGAP
jgi:hypothetical protein